MLPQTCLLSERWSIALNQQERAAASGDSPDASTTTPDWLTRLEEAFAVDASGTLPDGSSFKRPSELKVILKRNKDEFVRCLAGKMLTYALGRGLEAYDRCAVNDISGAVAKADYKFSALIHAVVGSDPFQKRRSPLAAGAKR